MAKCLICGADESAVAKMHHFPRNPNKLKIWQEKLGMRLVKENLRNYRICSKHFSLDSYIDTINHKLYKHAVPMQFFNLPPISAVHEESEESRVITVEESEELKEMPVNSDNPNDIPGVGYIDAIPLQFFNTPSTSGMQGEYRESMVVSEEFDEVPVNPDGPTDFTGVERCDSNMELDLPKTPKGKGRIFRENFSTRNTTPRKKRLVKIIRQKEDQLRKIKKVCRQKSKCLKDILELSDTPEVQRLKENMSETTWKFMLSQLRCSKAKDARGRRWSIDDKIMSLLLFKKSPRCYKLLSTFVALSSRSTILNLLKKVPFSAGININIFEHINENIKEDLDRYCMLLFDEMDIKENLYYDKGRKKIIGFEDFGEEQSGKCSARKALVFMLVGLNRKWKQPIAYFFTHKSCSSDIISKCLFNVMEAATNIAKLNIVGTVCDMGANNVKCLKELGVTVETPYFIYEGRRIFTMYDPPHSLKRTYSLFRKYNVFVNVRIGEVETIMEAKFSHVRWAYEHDKASPYVFRALHKLKDHFFNPIMKYAMKVNIAAQVMSRTVSAFLYTLITNGIMQQECIATAEFIVEVDTLFDSFNGNTNQSGKELRCNVQENSPHTEYWPKAFQIVKAWKFKRISKSGQVKESKPPSQIGWLTSLNAIREIWAFVRNQGFKVLRPRSLNQDPLENLFGCIRYGSGCNDNPSAFQFVGSLKSQILNNLMHSTSTTNCEEDNNVLLSNFKSFLTKEQLEESRHSEDRAPANFSLEVSTEETVSAIETDVLHGSSGAFSVAYVAGFILRGIFKKLKCIECSSVLLSDELDPHNLFIYNKEWVDDENHLTYPSTTFTISIGHGITSLEDFLDENAHICNLPYHASRFVKSKIDFEWLKCSKHSKEVEVITLQSIINIGIGWWVKRENQKFREMKNEIVQSKKLKKMKNM